MGRSPHTGGVLVVWGGLLTLVVSWWCGEVSSHWWCPGGVGSSPHTGGVLVVWGGLLALVVSWWCGEGLLTLVVSWWCGEVSSHWWCPGGVGRSPHTGGVLVVWGGLLTLVVSWWCGEVSSHWRCPGGVWVPCTVLWLLSTRNVVAVEEEDCQPPSSSLLSRLIP